MEEFAHFVFEGRYYVVAFENNRKFLVWTEIPDGFHWGKTIKSTQLVGNTKNPTKLARLVWMVIQNRAALIECPFE
ncbi:hypothetical protein C1J05_11185 [Sulfitobacter sp. JL08]|uniref:hypothetical protein n=1 Tax=Sulfitobacter sp. JL08 TaxID=2070369 RepID=UPI000E0AC120|nr:hypothetical protein [Sulfitobacter sp. JL08]AXI54976.1 hypothetical protein C1J05_11185 [Sulfitobacter sp. JL08]